MSSPYGPYRLPPTPPLPAHVRRAFRKKRLLKLRELTAAFGISERTIRKLAESGDLVCQSGELDPGHLFSHSDAAAFWKSVQRARLYVATKIAALRGELDRRLAQAKQLRAAASSEEVRNLRHLIHHLREKIAHALDPTKPDPDIPPPRPREPLAGYRAVIEAFEKKPLLDMHEFAAAFRIGVRTVRRCVQAGHIPCQLVGDGKIRPHRRFSRVDAAAYVNYLRRTRRGGLTIREALKCIR